MADEKSSPESGARHKRLEALQQLVRLCPRCRREWIVLGGGAQGSHNCKACGTTLLISKQMERGH
jgi:ribosomal protein L37AE/L43A